MALQHGATGARRRDRPLEPRRHAVGPGRVPLHRSSRCGRAARRCGGLALEHWRTRAPQGPCAFGIGTLFGKVELPFLRYNLFWYVYVLSFYAAARERREFREALSALEAKLVDGQVVVESCNRRLGQLAFCRESAPSRLATRRHRELRQNLAR